RETTNLVYRAGGELSEIGFADGNRAKYEYQPSGLRAKLVYHDGRRIEYTYDPAGNLLSSQIFDAKGKQVQGQKLTLNDSYQVIATRPITASFGTVRFSEPLGTFQLGNAAGNEIITPETTVEQALRKLTLVEQTTPLKKRQNLFNRPFNTIFMPAEYASINC